MNVELLSDLKSIRERWETQQLLDGITKQSDKKRIDYNHQVREMVKLPMPNQAPRKIEKTLQNLPVVFTNCIVN